MRISDLRERLALSFGNDWVASFCKDIAISNLNSTTVDEALDSGIEADVIWKAVCKSHPKETALYK